ncbi:PAQR family membrane homeostasis protein TrhA [Spongiivirga citrea]|uniref:Hemolysin III family protein n=1 Tax=Spongiivirga citrea TaxID=1481457 RepID=A0A6M0CLW4_9FLAO|nr:hemolysin III family protein [Spongiivirga citrea]NER18642.1 hemolysin III family protein [Spongiivirga citrea]
MYSKTEERWNAGSHALGAVLGVIGLFLLLIDDTHKTTYSTLSILAYSFSLILLFTASTMYHSIQGIKRKSNLRKLDHISIYFLIAGTYTPVCLISLIDNKGWLLFYIVWGITAFGTVLKIFFTGKFEAISLVLYAVMGWLIVLDWDAMSTIHSNTGNGLLMLGGAFYTIGIIFYAVKKIPYNHIIWHFFVLGGAISHFWFIWKHVI